MVFNSFTYALFLPTIFILYYLTPSKYRNFLLLLASYYFYMSWNPKLIGLILATTLVSFFGAKLIHIGKNPKYVMASIAAVCLGILGFFKYFNFLSATIVEVLRKISMPVNDFALDLILPIGISFYTFHTLSYVVDVYKKKITPESNFINYALYVSFFPLLVAGPIERPQNLLPQFRQKRPFDYDKAVYGAKLIALGAFKKIVIADTIARYVDLVYNNLPEYQGFALVLATFFFAIQIYCDFSGYTDIALGSAKLLGFDLMQNFNIPYLARNVKDFWSRWHISLSTWFKDYVYIPLGGSRVSENKSYQNLMITFLLSGLWHGANWTFVVWGAYHGALNVIHSYLQSHKIQIRAPEFVKVLFTFMLICIGWMLFRANSIGDAGYITRNFLHGLSSPYYYFARGIVDLNLNKFDTIYLILPVLVLMAIELVAYRHDVIRLTERLFLPFRYAVYFFFTYVPIYYFYYQVSLNAPQTFIYFQF